MSESTYSTATSKPDVAEVHAVARGIATAVAPRGGITDIQVALLRAITRAMTDVDVDYRDLEPLDAAELAALLARRPHEYRLRIVHHMVLGELVLSPLPAEVADRVRAYADALGVEDDFVRVARRYAEGALGLAWVDLRRSGFTEHWDDACSEPLHTKAAVLDPFDEVPPDPALGRRWSEFAEYPAESLGRAVWDMYRARGFQIPGTPGAASPYLAQHDFVHVIADYGTRMECEIEVFALIGRADPEPKGFAWLATMIGLFETGHVHAQGPFEMDIRERHLQLDGMDVRLADAIRRGKVIEAGYHHDLLDVDYHALAAESVASVRALLHVPPKAPEAVRAGSVGVFDPGGMSEYQRRTGAA